MVKPEPVLEAIAKPVTGKEKTMKKNVQISRGLSRNTSSRLFPWASGSAVPMLIPGYGKKEMGILHTKKAIYNKVYRKKTSGPDDLFKLFE